MCKAEEYIEDDQSPLRICIDRIIPVQYNPARSVALRAIRQNFDTIAENISLPELHSSGIVERFSAAIIEPKKWENGRTLKCRFLDGSNIQRNRVEDKAHIWEQYANIKFEFTDALDAEIRISFSADPGSWSAVGNDCLVEQYFPKFQPTMNFGWLRDGTDDTEYERVVVHEFGHALGLIHEHQSPSESLKWNADAVYAQFQGPPNFWTKDDIDHNILEKYSPEGLKFTPFDPDSIMLYMFPGDLFLDHKPTKNNIHLSAQDEAFIKSMYPKP